MHGLGVRLAEDDDRRRGLLVDVGGDDLALLAGELVELFFELLERRLVAALERAARQTRTRRSSRSAWRAAGSSGGSARSARAEPARPRASVCVRREVASPVLDLGDDAGDLLGKLLASRSEQPRRTPIARGLLSMRLWSSLSAFRIARTRMSMLFHPLAIGAAGSRRPPSGRAASRPIDLLRQVLDMELALLVHEAHHVEEQILRADDLDLRHRDQHSDHPPRGCLKRLRLRLDLVHQNQHVRPLMRSRRDCSDLQTCSTTASFMLAASASASLTASTVIAALRPASPFAQPLDSSSPPSCERRGDDLVGLPLGGQNTDRRSPSPSRGSDERRR